MFSRTKFVSNKNKKQEKIMKKTYIRPQVDVHDMKLQALICASLPLSTEDATEPAMGREEDLFFGEEVSF
jgi:hypothetical protein